MSKIDNPLFGKTFPLFISLPHCILSLKSEKILVDANTFIHCITSFGCVCMKYWVCPVKPQSWRVIRNNNLFGTQSPKSLQHVAVEDIVFFHVFKSNNGIIGMGVVTSKPFHDNQDVWGKDLYPYRIKIRIDCAVDSSKGKPVPLSCLFDSHNHENLTVEPYLRSVPIFEISYEQSVLLEKLLKSNELKKAT